jgi:MHS family proline/betaine transporter-like MFS transporter
MQKAQILTRENKEAIGLLSIGTFLEYFDMMLYIHMAILLNQLFFPKTSEYTRGILSAFAFCSSYIFRPIGALLFGYIGDHIGRKSSIVITTLMMAIACFVMAILPTYEQIGLTASVVMIICRIIQSLAATGELTGAQIYLTETLKPPTSYLAVGFLTEICLLGGTTALLIATIILKLQANWRIVFLLGSIVALIGTTARVRLKETIEFADFKRRMKKAIEESNTQGLGKLASLIKKTNPCWGEKTAWQTIVAYFAIYSGGPLCFYLAYIYTAEILRYKFNFSVEEVMLHNLKLSMLGFATGVGLIMSSKYFSPLKLIKSRGIGFLILLPIISMGLGFCDDLRSVIIIQSLLIIFSLGGLPAAPILLKHFPIFKRFTYTSLTYSVSRAVMYSFTSFGLIWIVEHLGKYGILVIGLPVAIGFLWGVEYFLKLEQEEENSMLKAKLGKYKND